MTSHVLYLQKQREKLQVRIDAMYEDKLDGRITQEFYDRKSNLWREEQENILRKIEKHQNANRTYLNEGVRLLELAQNAVKLYEKQEMSEKHKILNFVVSNSIWKHGRLTPIYRKPFDMILKTNRGLKRKQVVSGDENDLCPILLRL